MIIESIFLIIFLCSLGGILFIIIKKLPVLSSLPNHGTTGIKKHRIILDVENKIKDIQIYFEKQIFLHKLLSWVKIMTLKVETKVDYFLHRIRKNAQQVEKKHNRKKIYLPK